MLAALGGGGGGGGGKGSMLAALKNAGGAVMRCRRDLRVSARLQEWWEVVMAHQESVGVHEESADEDTYFDVFVKIYKAMVSEYSEWEAEEAVEADWESDSGGAGELTETAFKSVMFELAQTWTPGTSAAKYADFLRDLLHAVTELEPGDGDAPAQRVFRHDDDVETGSGQPSLFLAASNLDELLEKDTGAGGTLKEAEEEDDDEDEEWADGSAEGAEALKRNSFRLSLSTTASRRGSQKRGSAGGFSGDSVLGRSSHSSSPSSARGPGEHARRTMQQHEAAVSVQRRARGMLAREATRTQVEAARAQAAASGAHAGRNLRLCESWLMARLELANEPYDAVAASAAAVAVRRRAAMASRRVRGFRVSVEPSPRSSLSSGRARTRGSARGVASSPSPPPRARVPAPRPRGASSIGAAQPAHAAAPSAELPVTLTLDMATCASSCSPTASAAASAAAAARDGLVHSPRPGSGACAGSCFTRPPHARSGFDRIGPSSTRPATVYPPGPHERAVAIGAAADPTRFPPRPRTSDSTSSSPRAPSPRAASARPSHSAPRAQTAHADLRSARHAAADAAAAAAAAVAERPLSGSRCQGGLGSYSPRVRDASSAAVSEGAANGAYVGAAPSCAPVAVEAFPIAAPSSRAINTPRERPRTLLTPREHLALAAAGLGVQTAPSADDASSRVPRPSSPRELRLRAHKLSIESDVRARTCAVHDERAAAAALRRTTPPVGSDTLHGAALFGDLSRPGTASGRLPTCAVSKRPLLEQMLLLPPSKAAMAAARPDVNAAAIAAAAAVRWRVSAENVQQTRRERRDAPEPPPSPRAAAIAAAFPRLLGWDRF
jgi:hypothetical protein